MIPNRLQLVGENIIKYFNETAKSSMGNDEAQKHIAIILTLFMFILTANLVGQLPWKLIHLTNGELAAPTNDINMTAAMAIVVSIYYIFYGVKRNGFKFFFKGFCKLCRVVEKGLIDMIADAWKNDCKFHLFRSFPVLYDYSGS